MILNTELLRMYRNYLDKHNSSPSFILMNPETRMNLCQEVPMVALHCLERKVTGMEWQGIPVRTTSELDDGQFLFGEPVR